MSVIVSRRGGQATRLARRRIEKEEFLQSYIFEHPESLPLDEISSDLLLLILSREFPTNSGPIDALGVDQNGDIYVIETKLFKNPDKRNVLAQVLDYGASLWRTYEDSTTFLEALDKSTKHQSGSSLEDRLADSFGLDDDATADLMDLLELNQSSGRFRFVVLMDRIDDRLRDLITYMNQNSQFDVFGVVMDFYEFEDLDILIPNLFGAEVRKTVTSTVSRSQRRKWDEVSFFEEAARHLSAVELESLRQLYEHSTRIADDITWGTGVRSGSFNVKFDGFGQKSLYTATTNGQFWFNLAWLDWDQCANRIARLKERLEDGAGITLPEDYRELRSSIPVETGVWTTRVDDLVGAVEEVISLTD